MKFIFTIFIFLSSWGVVYPLCVLDSKRGWWLDCGIRDSYLFRIKDIGGIQANFDFGIGFGDENGFPNSISRTNKERTVPPGSHPRHPGGPPSYDPPHPGPPSYGPSYGPSYSGPPSYGPHPGPPSYGPPPYNPPIYIPKSGESGESRRKSEKKETSSKKFKFPYKFQLPFFKKTKSSKKNKKAPPLRTYIPSSRQHIKKYNNQNQSKERPSHYSRPPYSQERASYYPSKPRQSHSRDSKPFYGHATSRSGLRDYIPVSRSRQPSRSNTNWDQYSKEVYVPVSRPEPKREPPYHRGNSGGSLNRRSSHPGSRYSSREWQRNYAPEDDLRRPSVVDYHQQGRRSQYIPVHRRDSYRHRYTEGNSRFNPSHEMMPPARIPPPPPPSPRFRPYNDRRASSHFRFFDEPFSTTTPKPLHTIGPSLSELLKMPEYTSADSDHVPSFASKTFIVREAPKEFHPPNYDYFPNPFRPKRKVEIPRTKFYCEEQEYLPGIYADDILGCKMFHLCVPSAVGSTITSYLCPNGTLFDQSILQCNYWYNVDCQSSIKDYDSNLALALSYRRINAAHLPLHGAMDSKSLSLLSQNINHLPVHNSKGSRKFSRRIGKSLDFGIDHMIESPITVENSTSKVNSDITLEDLALKNYSLEHRNNTGVNGSSSTDTSDQNSADISSNKTDAFRNKSQFISSSDGHISDSLKSVISEVQDKFKDKRKDLISDTITKKLPALASYFLNAQYPKVTKHANYTLNR